MLDKNESPAGHKLFPLVIGSIGMVYGDIGTSPLYAFRESFSAAGDTGGEAVETVLGLLSLIIWSLVAIVSGKYITVLLRAGNNGEGGILSLMALAQNALKKKSINSRSVLLIGIIGASLFYGDALITPAISVLSAVEGLKLVEPGLKDYIMPIAVVIIILLFMVQRIGTNKVSRFFGPVMVLWFLALAAGGILHIKDSQIIWQAFNPYHAFYFIFHHGWASMIALGAVVLAVTGAEALYADMGHFGRKPMQLAWGWLVMPSLILNYLGQGALVISHPEAAPDSFFLLYPGWATVPMIILATAATIIASQAVITGVYSLTHQAVQLSLLPRMRVRFTSRLTVGQIYLPQVNWLLMIGVIFIMILFHNSSNLAAAYGIAVTGTMLASTMLLFVVMRHVWNWNLAFAALIIVPLIVIDFTFFSANLLKFMDGGYMPVLVSLGIILLMRTWLKGSSLLQTEGRENESIDALLKRLDKNPPQYVSGRAVYFSSSLVSTPAALLHNLKHNKVLHDQNVLLTLRFANKPYIKESERVEVKPLSAHFTRAFINFGYMEPTNVGKALKLMAKRGLKINIQDTSFFISRRNIVASPRSGMPLWQDRIFIMMADNASDAAEYFNIPRSRVVELGMQVSI